MITYHANIPFKYFIDKHFRKSFVSNSLENPFINKSNHIIAN